MTGAASRARRLRAPALVVAGLLVPTAYVAAVDPHEAGHYPGCPSWTLLGVWCPGCGMLRAVHDLAHLDPAGAMARNPLSVPLALGTLVVLVLWTRARWRGRPLGWVLPSWLPFAVGAGLVLFGVARNVPGWTWLSPA